MLPFLLLAPSISAEIAFVRSKLRISFQSYRSFSRSHLDLFLSPGAHNRLSAAGFERE